MKDLVEIKNHRKDFHVVLQEVTTTISKSSPNPLEFTNDNLIKINKNWN
jgi:hypothetical protein